MKKEMDNGKPGAVPQMGIAWYKPEQWERLLHVSEDRDDLEQTHAEWEAQAEEKIKALSKEGVTTKKVFVDIEALLAWCREKGVPVNGPSRSEYAACLMQKQDKST